MAMDGVPSGGFKSVGQIVGTNNMLFQAGQTGLAVAVELLSSHALGAPVVDRKGRFVGYISEFDVLNAIDSGKDLGRIRAEELMNKTPIAVKDSTSLDEAASLMKERHLLNLPVEKDGRVAYSITRHDLLRAKIGLGLDIEDVVT